MGDARLEDLLRPDLLSVELSESPRLRGLAWKGFCRLWLDCRPFDDGISFRNDINTDSSIRLYIILTAGLSVSGLGGVLWFGRVSNVSRTSLGRLISRGPSGIM